MQLTSRLAPYVASIMPKQVAKGREREKRDAGEASGAWSVTAQSTRGNFRIPVLPEFVNQNGAGLLLKGIDAVAAHPAVQLIPPGASTVTRALDRTDFLAPVEPWDVLTLTSRITKVFNKSVEIKVDAWAERLKAGVPTKLPIATSYLTYVALGADRKPMSFPKRYVPLSLEDFRHRREAAFRKEVLEDEQKTTPYTPLEKADEPYLSTNNRRILEEDLNPGGIAFGGVILQQLEETGRKSAERKAKQPMALTSVNRMEFISPAREGEILVSRAIPTKSWNTSLEVQVEADAFNPKTSTTRHPVAHAFMIYTSNEVNDNGQKLPIPPWAPQTEAQRGRMNQAEVRRENRLKEETASQAGFAGLVSPPEWFFKNGSAVSRTKA